MSYRIRLLSTACILSVLALNWGIVSRVYGQEPRPTISVSGNAKILVIPNQAVLQASVVSRFETLEEAVQNNRQAVQKVTAFLKESGIEERYIQTERISISPIWPERNPRASNLPAPPSAPDDNPLKMIQPIGYSVSRGFQITFVDLEKFETIYEGLLKRGVNTVGNLQFITTELRKFKDEARMQATRAAKEKATAMAEELGAKLDGVKSIDESQQIPFRASQNVLSNSISVSDDGAGISAGQIEISASVSVVFYLANPPFSTDH